MIYIVSILLNSTQIHNYPLFLKKKKKKKNRFWKKKKNIIKRKWEGKK